MHLSEKLDTAPVSKDISHRFENRFLILSAVGFISSACIYLLFI